MGVEPKVVPEQLIKLLNAVHSRDYYTMDNIPLDKLQTAINRYPVDLEDTPVALIDATVFKSAKNGMVIGLKGVYWKNDSLNETGRNFVSWEELADSDKPVYRTKYNIRLLPGCEFNMSGSGTDRDVLANLINRIVELYRKVRAFQANQAQPEGSVSLDGLPEKDISLLELPANASNIYPEIAVEMIALCVAADGKVDDSEVELVTALIEADDFIEDKQAALESLLSGLESSASDRLKSSAVTRLKATAIAAKAAKLDQDSKERLVVMLEGILDSINRGDDTETASAVNIIKKKIS